MARVHYYMTRYLNEMLPWLLTAHAYTTLINIRLIHSE